MATAEELLANDQCGNIIEIDLDSRTIIIPKGVTNIGVESDDSVLPLHFSIPRRYHGIDLSEFSFYINYENANGEGDLYDVTSKGNVVVSDDKVSFDWIVGRHACTARGNVEFSLCLKKVDGEVVLKEFNTTTAVLPVLKGLETSEAVIEATYDLIEQWRSSLFGTGDTVEQQIIQAGEEVKNAIDEKMNVSITDAVESFIEANVESFRGPKGETITSIKRTSGTGAAGTTDVYTITTNDGKTYSFSVYNGRDGSGAGDMIKSIYDPKGKNTDIFAYVDGAIPTDVLRYVAQTLTEEQQNQVRTNLEIYSKTEVDDAIPKDVLTSSEQTLTEAQQIRARTNLGIYSKSEVDNAISTAIAALPSETWTLEIEGGDDVNIQVVVKNA